MTASQFRSALDRVGASQAAFARLLGVSPRHVNRWAQGAPVPRYAEVVLDLMIQVPDEAWSCEEERQSCREGWTGVFGIVLDTGEYVWVNASYAHGKPKDVVQVGDARNNGYDRGGNCVLSVPASWCKFYTPDEADAIEHCL